MLVLCIIPAFFFNTQVDVKLIGKVLEQTNKSYIVNFESKGVRTVNKERCEVLKNIKVVNLGSNKLMLSMRKPLLLALS